LTEESIVKACCASCFELLYQADPPAVELNVRGVTIHQYNVRGDPPIANPPINCGPPSFVKTGCGESVEMD